MQRSAQIDSIPDVLPVLPFPDGILFPDMVLPVLVAQPQGLSLVNEALRGSKLVAVITQKSSDHAPPQPEDLYTVGTVAVLHELGRAEHTIRVAVQGIARVRTIDFVQTQPYLVARIELAREIREAGVELDALMRKVKELFNSLSQTGADLPDEFATAAERMIDARPLVYLIASVVPLPTAVRQEILEPDAPSARLRRLITVLQRELAARHVIQEVTAETAEEMTKTQREHILRKHMESIQRQLGELDDPADAREIREQLAKLPLHAEARKEATREVDRLERTPEISPEHGMIRTYLDWIIKLPWGKQTGQRIDVERARAVLDKDHYDLERVKDRILDYLAVKHLREERKEEREAGIPESDGSAGLEVARIRTEPILCFLGPPGVGKTSLGQSIARALGRAFVRQSLGGIHDEAEIRGHRRTYIGAMPGRIIQALTRAGAADPVFMLDEIDKLGAGFHGDPSAALLELLDPAQNHAFVDTYLSVPFDLSGVLFICTANSTDTIPPPLLDRMEVLQLAGYTEREKLQIALRFLVPSQLCANGLREGEVVLADDVIVNLIRGYTREAGVRNLEREIGTVLRKVARRIAERAPTPIHVRSDDLRPFLGQRRFLDEMAERIDRPGVAAGLSWTPAGGDVLFVEASMVPGREDRLILTGMLGNVMRESAEAALTYLRANAERLRIEPRALRERRVVHVHVPAGGIPKDGPSAGITMLVALASHALGRPVRPDVAMTGEITLRGKVLPVGGIKEKVLAAHRAGLATIIMPRRNEGDLDEVPEEVHRGCRFVLVDSIEEVLEEALGVPGNGPHASEAPASVH
jgi:ATP-dependent Lon protease